MDTESRTDLDETRIEQAEALYEKLVDLYPDDPRFLKRYAEILGRAGKFAQARVARERLESLLRRLGRHQEAEEIAAGEQRDKLGASFLDALDDSLLHRFVKRLRRKRLKPGEFLFRKGEKGREAGVVVAGQLVAFAERNAAGAPVVLNRLEAGDVVGEFAALQNTPRTAHVMATQDTEVFMISSDALHRLLDDRPDFRARIIREAQQRWVAGVMARHPVFARLPVESRLDLGLHSAVLRLPKGEILIEQGMLARDGWLVVSGEVKFVFDDPRGRSHVLDRENAPAFGGWLASGEVSPFSMVARNDVVAIRIPANALSDVAKASPSLAEGIAGEMERRMRELGGILSAIERVDNDG